MAYGKKTLMGRGIMPIIIKKPVVSICCTAYNHEKFIQQAIEGFLIQKTSFPFEIIIHDDASTDKTAAIVRGYAEKNPHLIKIILQKENQYKKGMLSGSYFGFEPLVRNVLPIAQGQYIALCEGDDYWTDPTKLQKQKEYLDTHLECIMCYHACNGLENDIFVPYGKKGRNYTKEELIATPIGIATATKMFRNIYGEDTKQDFLDFSGDYLLNAYLGTYGKCDYLSNIKPSVYRIHKDGVWSGMTIRHKIISTHYLNVRLYDLFRAKGNRRYTNIRRRCVVNTHIFGIVIPTYQRDDGKTPFYLKRALDSIFAQTHTDFMVYVIGDKYVNEEELRDIVSKYPTDKCCWENLPEAHERDKYTNNKEALWSSGGLFATNYGTEKAIADGIHYICMLDHDDYWTPNHLELLNETLLATNADWLCTKSSFVGSKVYLPKHVVTKKVSKFLPLPKGCIKSSVCYNARTIPVRGRDVFAETGNIFPSDADLWGRMADYIIKNKLQSYHISEHTCIHDSEGYERSPKGCLVTLITPTGDRPEAFELTRRWIASQTKQPDQWIVIDDGKVPLPERLREGLEYVRREPRANEGHTLNLNMKRAVPLIRGAMILIIEDDDWYGPDYIAVMSKYLQDYNLVGEGCARYYYLPTNKYHRVRNIHHASFCQTGFTRDLLPVFVECIPGDPYIDARFWEIVIDKKLVFTDVEDKLKLHCSLKGLKGRKGIGTGHDAHASYFDPDVNLKYLIKWVGKENAEIYMNLFGKNIKGETISTKEKKDLSDAPKLNIPSNADVTVITCTGDRPESFALLQKWMAKQTVLPKQWIVVDDGREPLKKTVGFEYIRREPTISDYTHTLCLNLEKALAAVNYNKIVIMEDDDWYDPTYIDYMSKLLDRADLVGFGNLIFYYPKTHKYMVKGMPKNPAFAQTAFKKVLIPVVQGICRSAPKEYELCGKGLVDRFLWNHSLDISVTEKCVRLLVSLKISNGRVVPAGTVFPPPIPTSIIRRAEGKRGAEYFYRNVLEKRTKLIVTCEKYITVGMKGMLGRKGLTTHHNIDNRKYKEDVGGNMLKSILKSDADFYLDKA